MDELVKRLREHNGWALNETLDQAADAIEELSRENESLAKSVNEASELLQKRKPRWISVEERLPEEVRKSYLCRTDSGYHCEVRWTDNVYGLWTGGGGQWGWSIFDIPQYAKVTHWMPLPQPPKEE